MAKKTQKQIVIDRLNKYKEVDNFWAFHNYILRLGAIIYELRQEGWEFTCGFGTGRNKKNYIYKVVKRPNPFDVIQTNNTR